MHLEVVSSRADRLPSMLISVILPAFRAQATIARALSGLFAQTLPDWEAIIVSDDGSDYAACAAAAGLADPRLRFTSSGGLRRGCHRARNAGLAAARGDLILHCDADDTSHPTRLERLLPIALARGAAVDNPRVVNDADGVELYRAFADHADRELDIAALLATTVPLFPLIRRDLAVPRLEGVENAEDVVANLRLIDSAGPLRAIADNLSDYHVAPGSMTSGDDAAGSFDAAYGALINRLEHDDGLGLSAEARRPAREGLLKKRALNRAFGEAAAREPGLLFQHYAARLSRQLAAKQPLAERQGDDGDQRQRP